MTTYSADQLKKLKARGAQYIVVSRGDIGFHRRGEVVSWHKTHEAACKAGKGDWFRVEDIDDAIHYANW
jgi:hypothetical protein